MVIKKMITGNIEIDENIRIESGFSGHDSYIFVLWKNFAINFISID